MQWYWWLLIGIIALIILLSLIGSLIGANQGPASFVSNTLLGLAGGILNMLEKDPFFQFFVLIWAFPYIINGGSALVSAYRLHFSKEGSSFQQQNKDMGVDPDSIRKALDKQSPDKSPAQKEHDALKELQTNVFEVLRTAVEQQAIAIKGNQEQIIKLNEIIDSLNQTKNELEQKDEINEDTKDINDIPLDS